MSISIHPIQMGLDTVYVVKGESMILIDGGDPHKLNVFQEGLEKASINPRDIQLIILTHGHWDHIQGFPMFRQHMNPNVTIRVLCEMNPSWADLFLSQMDGIRFPITLDELTADVAGYSDDLNDLLSRFGVAVTWIRLNHRGECYGYKISSPSGTLMYITDHEMDATSHVYTSFDELATFCSDADILIHDGHFTEDQMSSKSGFGHTSVERACELAAKANAKQLVLFHHDPGRTDDMLDENLRLARAHLESLEANVHCITAFEGLHLEL